MVFAKFTSSSAQYTKDPTSIMKTLLDILGDAVGVTATAMKDKVLESKAIEGKVMEGKALQGKMPEDSKSDGTLDSMSEGNTVDDTTAPDSTMLEGGKKLVSQTSMVESLEEKLNNILHLSGLLLGGKTSEMVEEMKLLASRGYSDV
jgi:hypothetical protein